MPVGTWPDAWGEGAVADRPSAGDVGAGSYYYATDEHKLYRSDGVSTWSTIDTFSAATHVHSGADITSGTVVDARIDSAIARDSELPTRTTLGLATGDTPQLAGLEVGHASDTTLSRASAGVLQVEGQRIFAVGGADVPVADGGTGASTASAARTNLGVDVPGAPAGLTGAVAATRYVGGTASVAPTTGTFAVGDFVITQAGSIYICTVAGSPGTWVAVSGGGGGSALEVKDEGVSLDSAVTSIDFVGGGVQASVVGHAITVTAAPAQGFVGARAKNTAGTSISNNTETAVPFATEDYDSDSIHDTVTNNSRVTVPAGMGGYWRITAQWGFDAGAGTRRYAYLMKNAATIIAWSQDDKDTTSLSSHGQLSASVALVPGDYVELYVAQNSGGSLALATGAGENFIEAVKLDSGKVGQGIGARATNTAGTSFTSGSAAAVPYATEDWDTDGFHDNSTNNSRLTCPAGLGGKYLVVAQFTWGSNFDAGSAYVIIRKNGTTDYTFQRFPSVSSTSAEAHSVSAIVDLAPGDYVELIASQNSGSSKSLEATAGYNSFSIARLDSGSANAGAELGYTEVTSDLSVTATSEGAAQTFVTSASITFDGAPVFVEFYTPRVTTGASAIVVLDLYQDSTILGRIAVVQSPAAAALIAPVLVKRRVTPAAGAHTFTVKAWRATADGTVGAGSGGTGTNVPAYIRVTRL